MISLSNDYSRAISSSNANTTRCTEATQEVEEATLLHQITTQQQPDASSPAGVRLGTTKQIWPSQTNTAPGRDLCRAAERISPFIKSQHFRGEAPPPHLRPPFPQLSDLIRCRALVSFLIHLAVSACKWKKKKKTPASLFCKYDCLLTSDTNIVDTWCHFSGTPECGAHRG